MRCSSIRHPVTLKPLSSFSSSVLVAVFGYSMPLPPVIEAATTSSAATAVATIAPWRPLRLSLPPFGGRPPPGRA